MRCPIVFLVLGWLVLPIAIVRADKGDEFFERKIRPVLVKHCYSCHSAAAATKKTLKGGLRLDTRAGTRQGGDSGPAIVPGKPAASLLIAAIRHESLKMPPQGKLPAQVIRDFVAWVRMGAPFPRGGKPVTTDLHAAKKLWAFRPPRLPKRPRISNRSWPRGDIDRLILARFETNRLQPAAAADKRTLIRRATYDLLGLPPTGAEVSAFLKDNRPDSFERLIDRLLKSPDFGIRWARHWLDNVRFAHDDPTCAANNNGAFSIEPYRDWVVKSLNKDLPYDQFVRLQVAGDLIPVKGNQRFNVDGLTATGIWGLAHLVEGNDKEKVVADFVDEQLDVLGRTFLGLTISCARCHDHKFDPISQADYYGLAGIFYSSHIFRFEGKSARVRQRVQLRAYSSQAEQQRFAADEQRLRTLQKQIDNLADRFKNALELMQARRELKMQLKVRPRTANERVRVARRIKTLRRKEANLVMDQKKGGWNPNPPELKQHAQLTKQAKKLSQKLARFPLRMAMSDGPVPGTRHQQIGDLQVFIRGNHLQLGKTVPRAAPRLLTNGKPFQAKGSGRLALARWLTRRDHPLTARVMANRLWQHLFGRGIVASSSNFGRLGRPPTHPQLLDYLAIRLTQNGWSIKALIREIMVSRTYQQASRASAATLAGDPGNRWFSRMNRKRLDAEALMDSLAWHDAKVRRSRGGNLANGGRALFRTFRRDKPPTELDLFDGASPDLLVPRRADSTSALQSLFMLNSDAVQRAARSLAARVTAAPPKQRLQQLYLQLFGRSASKQERFAANQILGRLRSVRQKTQSKRDVDIQLEVWTDLCVALICSNEFLYVD